MKLRACQQTDAPGLTASLHRLGGMLTIAAETPDVTQARIEKHLARIIASDEHTLLVAIEGENLAGYISVHWHPTFLQADGEGFISELFVHPDYRMKGLGSTLIDQVRGEAVARGCARLSLLNMRHKKSYELGFYAKRGWEERANAANFILELE